MRSDWVPLSASALVTGVMALAMGQMLNPGGGGESPLRTFGTVMDHPNAWLGMSILYFLGAATLVFGMPCAALLFTGRGRGLGLAGIVVFTVGCVGVAGLAALMLFFRALALAPDTDPNLVVGALEDPGLVVMLAIWVYSFLGGVLLIAIALLRARVTPVWVPLLLLAFLVLDIGNRALEGDASEVVAALSLVLLAVGFTGMATTANSAPSRHRAARESAYRGSISGTNE